MILVVQIILLIFFISWLSTKEVIIINSRLTGNLAFLTKKKTKKKLAKTNNRCGFKYMSIGTG